MAIPGIDSEDFSASATIVAFDHPIPLLRGPIPAGPSDDPSIGPFILAFRDERCWRSALRATEAKIIEQCEAGARVGCSISASTKCKPPWWKVMFGAAAMDFAERERCEEREMSACLAAAKESCLKFAKEKCFPAFQDARIALPGQKGIPGLLFWDVPSSSLNSSVKGLESSPVESLKLESLQLESDPEATNYRGNILLETSTITKLAENESSCSGKSKD